MSLLALVAAALALGLACARVALGGARGRWAIAAFALLGAVGGLAAPLAGAVVEHDLTVLHEGGSMRTLQAIFGQDGHVGWLWRDAAGALRWDENELPIVALVRLNIALAALSAAALAVVASVAAEHAAAGAVALVLLAGSRGFWNAACSETPAPAVWFAFVAAAPAWKILDEARARPPHQHLLAFASLAACGALAGGVRDEFIAYGGLFAALGLGTFLQGAAAFDGAYERVRGAAVRVLHAPLPLRVAIVCAAVVLASVGTRFGFHARLALSAAFSTLSLQAPVALLAVTPLPVVALSLVGAASLARGGPVRAAFALGTTALLGVYLVASHGVGWEMLRYGCLGAMGVWLAAVAGWRVVEGFARERSWHPSWRSSLALLSLVFVPLPGRVDAAGPDWWDASARARQVTFRQLANQTSQREARAIVHALIDDRDCLFVARARRGGELRGAMVLVTFGEGRGPAVVADPAVTMRDLRAAATSCLRYFRTLDCDLPSGARCDEDVRGAAPLTVARERLAAYSDPDEYGEHAPEVRYGVWRVGD